MSARLSTRYSIIESQGTIRMQSLNDSLPGRMLTVLFATLAASGLAYLVYRENQAIRPEVLHWALIGGIGFCAGFAARAFMSGRTFMLRLLTALLSILAGLILLGLVSGETLGAAVPRSDQQALNLAWIGEFGLASLTALFSLSAWKASSPAQTGKKSRLSRRSRIGGSRSKLPVSDGKQIGSSGKTSPKSSPSQPNAGGELQPEIWAKRWKQLQRKWQGKLRRWWKDGIPDAPLSGRGAPPPSASTHAGKPKRKPAKKSAAKQAGRTAPASQVPPGAQPGSAVPKNAAASVGAAAAGIKSQARKKGSRKSIWGPGRAQMNRVRRIVQPRSARSSPETSTAIRLIGKEEHRCPFCLEMVVPGDPRGVKTCPICRTRHHADCWAVTGTCQVPHYHE